MTGARCGSSGAPAITPPHPGIGRRHGFAPTHLHCLATPGAAVAHRVQRPRFLATSITSSRHLLWHFLATRLLLPPSSMPGASTRSSFVGAAAGGRHGGGPAPSSWHRRSAAFWSKTGPGGCWYAAQRGRGPTGAPEPPRYVFAQVTMSQHKSPAAWTALRLARTRDNRLCLEHPPLKDGLRRAWPACGAGGAARCGGRSGPGNLARRRCLALPHRGCRTGAHAQAGV